LPIKIIRQDIVKIKCDAIVNPTDSHYTHCGGVDAAIHEAVGEDLYQSCVESGWISVGQAIVTPAFSLAAKYIIHTVGPVWEGGNSGEEILLRSCYKECLKLARINKCKSIAFPLIASGAFGFPKDRVLKIAVDVISSFLCDSEMLVYIVVFDKASYSISEKLFLEVTSFIDDAYLTHQDNVLYSLREERIDLKPGKKLFAESIGSLDACSDGAYSETNNSKSLKDMLNNMDKGFAETLFHYIDKKGISDVECYKRANVDKKTFSKIKCNKDYKPSKKTAVSFAIALHLNLDETNHLLNTVGMALSRSSIFDIIIEYFITTGNYTDIYDVNETLYQFDQMTLGV